MFVVRPSRLSDLDGLQALAEKTGIGFTTLPAHRPTLQKKLEASEAAFKSTADPDSCHTYLLVLEDTEAEKVVGTAAMLTGVGLKKPFYNYRLLNQTQVSYDPPMRVDTEILHLSNDFARDTEVGTLFLDPDYRRDNLGKLLAKARYMFIANNIDRFADRIFAEMRGWVDETGKSPFWEAIGRHFFGIDFAEADKINGQGNNQFIADMMPKYPIYTALLPESARAVIGLAQEAAIPACKMLEKEGFRFSGAVDIFDAGPVLEVDKRAIWTVRNSARATLQGTVDGKSGKPNFLVANPSIKNFRVTLGAVVESSDGVWLSSALASLVKVEKGAQVSFAPISPPLADSDAKKG